MYVLKREEIVVVNKKLTNKFLAIRINRLPLLPKFNKLDENDTD